MDRDAMRTHAALQDPPASRRVEVLQRRTRVEIKPWHAQTGAAPRRLLELRDGDPATAHIFVDPERGKSWRQAGPGRLVVVDHQRVAAGPPVDLHDQRKRYCVGRLQDGVETVADPGERRSLMLPERLPDSPGDDGRMLRPLAQVEDAEGRRAQATFFVRCGNIARRAVSSISVLKVCLSFSASARTAAGRALISPRWRCRLGSCLAASAPSTLGIRRDQPHTAMSTMV